MYIHFNGNPCGRNIGDCVIRAISIVTGFSRHKVYAGALELDGVKAQLAQAQRENVGLQNAVNMATMQASQVQQTAQIRDGQNAAVNALVTELRSCPIPSQPVYGNQPIFTCPNNNNGCGCGGF